MQHKLLLTSLLLLHLFARSQSVGIGTAIPQDKVHIKDGDLLLENSKFTTVKTGRGRNLAPIAIASINGSHVLSGGTANVTVSNFGITVDIGEDNAGTQAFATAVGSVKFFGVVTPLTGANNTKLDVHFYDANGNEGYPAYSLIVYKTGTDAYREYNITIQSDTNGIDISHGNFGISTAAVDSLRITILIPNTVTIGGGSSTGSGININLPARSSVKITNYGKIIGRGGSGGVGEGTYAAGAYVGPCGIFSGAGLQGGSGISTNTKVVVDNYGFIAGAGGGGGGGKKGGVAGANGGGGGAGAGWPIPAGVNGFGVGGSGGSTWLSVSQGGYCPSDPFACNNPAGCCCGLTAPYGTNGSKGTYTSGINYLPGGGGAGVNGGFSGLSGGALGQPGQSGPNTGLSSVAGKAIYSAPQVTGNVVNNLSGGTTVGVID
ncbi:MAG: hypothetical protein V4722_26570 [Bacteroidota bacterium]